MTDCFEDTRLILLGRTLLDSGTRVCIKWMPAHQSARQSTLVPRSKIHRGRSKRRVVRATDLLALQSFHARLSRALAAFVTCLRSSQHTYEAALDTIDRWAGRRQACVSVHLDRHSRAPSWRREDGRKSQNLVAGDMDHVEDVGDAGTGKHQETTKDSGGELDVGKQRSRRKG